MNTLRTLLIPLITLLLAGCGLEVNVEKHIPKEIQAFAQASASELEAKNLGQIEAKLAKAQQGEATHHALMQIANMIPGAAAKKCTYVGFHQHSINKTTTFQVISEREYDGKFVTLQLTIKNAENKPGYEIVGLNASDSPISLTDKNKFTTSGKSPASFVFMALAAINPAFIITTLIICVRTKVSKRKWAWIIGILFGIPTIYLNWTTEVINTAPLRFQLLGAGFIRASQFSPTIISFGIPIGAIAFWIKRKSISQSEPPTLPAKE